MPHPMKQVTLQSDLVRALQDGPCTRDDLVRACGHPRSTIYDHLKPLIVGGLVVARHRDAGAPRGRGRPIVEFALQERDAP